MKRWAIFVPLKMSAFASCLHKLRAIFLLGVSLTGIALCLAPLALLAQDNSFEDEVRKLLDDGLDAYQRGKYGEAYTKLESAMEKKPSNDLLYAFVQRATEAVIISMASSNDERLRNTGIRLIELSKPKISSRKELVANIDKYLDALRSDKQADVLAGMYHIVNAGPYAVKFLVPILGEKKDDLFRTRVINTLVKMGPDSVNGLISALDSKNDFMRENAAIVLGYIKDERAVAGLKKVWETDKDITVKKYSDESLQKITHKTVDELPSAKEEYYSLAERYYYSLSSVMPAYQREYIIWRWDTENDKPTEREVPPFAFNEQMAENACYEALEIDPNYERVWPLLVSCFLSQHIKAKIAIETAERLTMAQEIEPTAVESLKKGFENIGQLNVLAGAAGRKYLYQTLERALEDGNALVARNTIDIIKELGKADDLPPVETIPPANSRKKTLPPPTPEELAAKYIGYPLVKAITDPDKRVRYAAAQALVHIAPQDNRLGLDLVMPNIIDALGEESVRVALVIWDVKTEEDHAFVNKFRKTLIKLNVFPIIARSGAEGIIRAKSFPSIDVIFLQSKTANQVYFAVVAGKEVVVESIFDSLKEDVRTRSIPIYLINKDDNSKESAKQIYTDKMDTYMLEEYNELDLRAWLEKTFSSDEAKKDAQKRALDLAQQSAEALKDLKPVDLLFRMFNKQFIDGGQVDVIKAMIKDISPDILREDELRLPCIVSLGGLEDPRALGILSKLLADKATNSVPIRLACAKAIGSILHANEMAPPDELFDILKNTLTDDSFDIQLAVADVLGNAKLTNQQRFDIAKFKRLKRESQ